MLKIDTNSILRVTDEVVQTSGEEYKQAFLNQGLLNKTEANMLHGIYTNPQNKFTHVRVYFGTVQGEFFAYDACTAKFHTTHQTFAKRNKTVEVTVQFGTVTKGTESIDRTGANLENSNMVQAGFKATDVTATITIERLHETFGQQRAAIALPVTTLNIYIPQERLQENI